jgi:plasmid replication initiation protein
VLTPTTSDDENFHIRRLTRLGARADDVKRGRAISHFRFRISDRKSPDRIGVNNLKSQILNLKLP